MDIKTNFLAIDVLIIGSGGAGCRAAIEAHDAGARVAIVTKGIFGRSGTTAFNVADSAGYNWADGEVDPLDSPETHFKDIMDAALGMAYEELASILAQEAPSTATYLEKLGVDFEKEPDTGRYIEVKGCFASRSRMHILKGHGKKIIQALVPEVLKRGILIIEKTAVFQLLIRDGRCVGAVGINLNGDFIIFEAKSVVLACGGAGQLFRYTLTPQDITGDGYALGLRAGADLVNMEFMQVVLGTVYPTRNQFNTFLWSARPSLLDGKKNPLLEKYLPANISIDECFEDKSKHFPFSTRDQSRFVEIAIQKEMTKGGIDPDQAVFVDLTKITDDRVNSLPKENPLTKIWPILKKYYIKKGLPIEKEPIPIGCFAHAINGGLKINRDGQTTIEGLYAAGEVAGGPHGADRLGGNMLVTCQVFGARAGKTAAKNAGKINDLKISYRNAHEELDWIYEHTNQKGDIQVEQIKDRIKDVMWKGVLVVRRKEKLELTIESLKAIKKDIKKISVQSFSDLFLISEIKNLIDVGTAICKAALHRQESRGSHYREDYPSLDKSWEKKILLRYKNDDVYVIEEHE